MRRFFIVLAVLLVAGAVFVLFVLQKLTEEKQNPVTRILRHGKPESFKWSTNAISVVAWNKHVTEESVAASNTSSGQDVTVAESNAPVSGKIPNEFVLSFYNEQDRKAFIEAAKANGVEILGTMPFANSVKIRVKDQEQLARTLAGSPVPVGRESNYYIQAPDPVSNRTRQAPVSDYAGFGARALKWLGVDVDNAAWGAGVTVAVLDTEVIAHPALDESRITRVTYGEQNENTNASGEYAGHGTAITSLIAGNGNGVQGMAPSARILNIQVMSDDGRGDSFTLARGIVEAVDRGANIINLCVSTDSDSTILKQAVDYALSKGVAVIAAAGNDAVEGVSYPARYEGVTAVSAVDAAERHLYFANRGEEVDIAAPGIGINAAWSEGKIVGFSGTSAAVPFISGAAASLMSQNPGMTPEEAVQILSNYADDAGAPGRDEETGDGIIDIRRVLDRDKQGIYDIAACNPYVKDPENKEDAFTVIVYGQNRGTERLDMVDLKVKTGDDTRVLTFYNVAVNETVSHQFQVTVARVQQFGPVQVSCSVEAPGVTDAYPDNNISKAVLLVYDKQAQK